MRTGTPDLATIMGRAGTAHRSQPAAVTHNASGIDIRAGEVRNVADRMLYKDIIPYDTPSSLDALRGPATGILEVPITVHWGPRRRFDLDEPRDAHAAYRAIVREGTTAIQEELLHTDVLRRLWPDLMLPERCRRIWEQRFPDLAT